MDFGPWTDLIPVPPGVDKQKNKSVAHYHSRVKRMVEAVIMVMVSSRERSSGSGRGSGSSSSSCSTNIPDLEISLLISL